MPHKPDEDQRHAKIDEAIENSIAPSPDGANEIARRTGEHPSLVHRRLKINYVWRGGRWVYRHKEGTNERN